MNREVLISCSRICKNFGATRALIDVDFELRRGEVCGLIGENGSGKSTLTSIFAGVQPATSGEMFRAGQPYAPHNMVEAQKAGVAMIVQEAGTLREVDVASNIFVGNYGMFSKHGILNIRRMHAEAAKILKEIGAEDIRPDTPVASLNFEDRKIVEIARAMYLNPEILVIDESTTALAQKGRQLIYKLIDKLRAENKGVIFISHDLEELESVCNKITCLRDGVMVGHLEGEDIRVANMRPLMVGRELQGSYYRADYDGTCSEKVVLDVRHIGKRLCAQLQRPAAQRRDPGLRRSVRVRDARGGANDLRPGPDHHRRGGVHPRQEENRRRPGRHLPENRLRLQGP